MPNANIELDHELLGAYLGGDEERLREQMDPEIAIHRAPGIVNAGAYHGFAGFQLWISQSEEISSGAETASVFGWLFEPSDGRAVRFRVHPALEDALTAAPEIDAERT